MARAAKRFEDALVKQANAASRLSPEFKIVEAAMLGLGNSTISLIKSLSSTSGAFASVSASGATAFNGISGAAAGAASAVDQRIALIVAKVREARAQAEGLRESAKGENSAGTLSDDGLKQKLAGIKLTQAAYAELAKAGIAQELAAQQVAEAEAAMLAKRTAAFERLRATVEKLNFEKSRSDTGAERISSSKGAVSAIDGAATAQASAQAQVYAAFLNVQAVAAQTAAQAEARLAEVTVAVSAAGDRARASQQAAYETKVAFIGKVNEEAAALFRTKDAQRQLDAERAGVSPQQAAQLAKFSGDREFTSTIYQAIAAEQKKSVEFGKSATEIFKQDAALRGLTNTTASAISRFDALAVANQKVAASAAKSSEDTAFLQGLKNTEAQIGKTRAELLAYQATQRGLGKEAAGTIASIAAKDLKVAREGFNAAGNAVEHFGLQSVGAKRELLVLAHELSQGNYSRFGGSLLVLAERTNAAEAATKLLTGGIGLSVIGIGAGVIAVGALAAAYIVGAHQSKVFADSVVLTGNFSGITEGKFNSLTKGIAASGQVSISAAREFTQALISTGEIGPKNLEKAGEAAARYGAVTGKSAKDVATEFVALNENVTLGATNLNKTLNFLSAAQLQQIKTFQDHGQAADALGIVYDALNARFGKLEPNLGNLDKLLRSVTGTWHGFWNAAFDVGRAETLEQKLANVQARLAGVRGEAAGSTAAVKFGEATIPRLNIAQPPTGSFGAFKLPSQPQAPELPPVKFGAYTFPDNRTSSLEAEEAQLKQKISVQNTTAATVAAAAATTKLAQAGRANVEALLVQGKFTGEYDKAVLKLNKELADNVKAGTPFTAKEEAAARKELKKKFTDKAAVTESDDQRKAILDRDLHNVKERLASEEQALKFHADVVKAIYAEGNISLAAFYDDRDKTRKAEFQSQLNANIGEQARLEVELKQGKFKAPHEAEQIRTRLTTLIADGAKISVAADREAALAVFERAAAVKALTQQVEAFNANLLQSKGDDFGAAQLRNAQALRDALKLAREATPLQSTGDFAREEHRKENGTSLEDDARQQGRLNDAAAQFAEIQKRVGIATANATRSEELYTIISRNRGDTQLQQDAAVFLIRSKLVDQLAIEVSVTQALADANIAAATKAGEVANPKVLADAADAALRYAKALDSVDPALNRLRTETASLASSLANSLASFDQNFFELYAKRKNAAAADVQAQRVEYDNRINVLEGYLAKSQDASDKARLRAKIKDLESKRADAKADSKGDSFLKTVGRDVLAPLAKQVYASVYKVAFTDPMKNQIEVQLKGLTEGDGVIAKFFKETLGIKAAADDPAKIAALASARALDSLTEAANRASGSLGGGSASGAPKIDFTGQFAKFAGASNDPSASNYENESDKASTAAEAAKSIGMLGKTASSGADVFSTAVSTLVSSTGKAGAAIAGLPGVISNISSYVYSLLQSVSGSSSSGAGSLIGSLFGGGGGSSVGSSASYAASDFIAAANGRAFSTSGVEAFAKGDIFNTPTAFRFARGGGFANGVMGEAGPEAVMPLRRGADGKLGVASAGGSNANVYHINVTTEAAPNMSRDTALQQGANIGAGIQRALARNG